ncbi:MAG: hypothetical protein Q9220_007401 [cf. Caloplaca sp. 1 TL-2023]
MFQYQRLHDDNQLRVVTILPGLTDEPISCQMHVHAHSDSGEDEVPYEALSYVWGNSTVRIQIVCDSALIEITQNLHIALQHLRRPDHPRALWVDALCINQADVEEKSIQVKAMGKIYSKATQVLMWQGEETEDTRDSLESLAQLCALATAGTDSKEWQDFLLLAQHANSSEHRNDENTVSFQANNPGWASIAALLARPYFARRWIGQEIILARKASMVLGSRILDWALICDHLPKFGDWAHVAFSNICFIVGKGQQGLWPKLFNMVLPSRARNPDSSQVSTEFSSLYNTLWYMSSLECSDPRDELYALLHMASDVDLAMDTDLVPDYTLTEAEVLHSLAIWIIVRKRQPSYMSFAVRNSHELQKKPSDLPSWVPPSIFGIRIIKSLQYQFSRYFRLTSEGLHILKAEEQNDNPMKNLVELSEDRRMISIIGKIIDHVDQCSSLLPNEVFARRDFKAFIELGFSDKFGLSGLVDLATAWWLRDCVEILCGTDEDWSDVVCSDRFIDYLDNTLAYLAIRMKGKPSSERKSVILRYVKYMSTLIAWQASERMEIDSNQPFFTDVWNDLGSTSRRYRFCRTRKDRMGFIVGDVQPGDLVCALDGTQVPWVIRPSGSGTYSLVGECCLENFLHGEAFQLSEIPDQVIRLT